MEAYLDGIPRSTSSTSLSASNSSSTLDQQSAPTSSRSTSSSYWTSSISSVWSGLKAAAGSEVKGFLKAVQGKVSGEDLGGRLGDKRRRGVQDGDLAGLGEPGMNKEAQAKRRKTDSDSSKSLVSPGFHSEAHKTSSPSAQRPSSSPEAIRRRVRPYTDPSYADELMYSDGYTASNSNRASTEQGGLRSLSGKRRIGGGTNEPRLDTGVTSATSGTSDSTLRRMRDRSRSQNHVHFVFPPSSSSSSLATTSTSVKSPRKGEDRNRDQPGNMLVGAMGTDVNRVWREAKEKEKTSKTQRRIAELESEVQRLKSELSSKSHLSPGSNSVPPKSPYKSPRRFVAPPPPPPPPPPPLGKARIQAHPVLFTARASLRATPPRASHKRRSSAIGGVEDMDAFLGELGEKRGKLRKVGFPTKEHKKGGNDGELTEVLQKAFARKFAHTNGLASPSFNTPIQSSKSYNNLQIPQWSTSRHSPLTKSQTQPNGLSSVETTNPPSQPVFKTSSPASDVNVSRHPRSTSLVSTETTVFGQALTSEISSTTGHSRRPSQTSNIPASKLPLASSSTSRALSPSASYASLPSAPPEEADSMTRSPNITSNETSLEPHPPIIATTPAQSTSPKSPNKEQLADSASKRLSAARKRSSLENLPGLDAGIKRPITPGRAKRRAAGRSPVTTPTVASEGESDTVVLVQVPRTEKEHSKKHVHHRRTRSQTEHEHQVSPSTDQMQEQDLDETF